MAGSGTKEVQKLHFADGQRNRSLAFAVRPSGVPHGVMGGDSNGRRKSADFCLFVFSLVEPFSL